MPPVADDHCMLLLLAANVSNKVPGLPMAASLGLRLPSLMWQLGESSVPVISTSRLEPCQGPPCTCPKIHKNPQKSTKIHKTCTKIGNQYATESEEARCSKDQFMHPRHRSIFIERGVFFFSHMMLQLLKTSCLVSLWMRGFSSTLS